MFLNAFTGHSPKRMTQLKDWDWACTSLMRLSLSTVAVSALRASQGREAHSTFPCPSNSPPTAAHLLMCGWRTVQPAAAQSATHTKRLKCPGCTVRHSHK